MIPDFLLSPEPETHFGLWRTIIGVVIVLLGTFVGVEIRIGNDDDDST